MRTAKAVSVKEQELVSITCDRCHKEYTVADDNKDCRLELQEFHTIHFMGGYSSIFGDGTTIHCDICQHCLYELIKDFMVATYEGG